VPLYFCGARMERAYGLGPILNGSGLFHVVGSYERDVAISFTACRELIPDPTFYTNCIIAALDELRTATRPASQPTNGADRPSGDDAGGRAVPGAAREHSSPGHG
jgi:diacylglycerol O-acyltransferase